MKLAPRLLPAILSVVASFAGSALAAAPVHLVAVDPLAEPAPALTKSLALPSDVRRPEEKIVPALWARIAKGAAGDALPVIVELQQPVHRAKAAAHSAAWDDEQAELCSAVEHRFAAKASGIANGLRGISHAPLVFATIASDRIAELAAMPEVLRIYEDHEVHVNRVEGAALMHADTLRTTLGGNGAGIGVAILDTGIGSHPELVGRVVTEGDFTGTTGSGTIDDNGHGTRCAGIVAGNAGGMAPQANLWAIKVLHANGGGTDSEVLAGLNSIYANRNNFGGLRVVNMSFGGGGPINADCDGTSVYNSVISNLYGAGIAMFVASGNDGFAFGVSEPACHSKVVAVGAVYDTNVGAKSYGAPASCTDPSTAADKITCYSNSGNPLDVLAPSTCARTTTPGGGYDNCFSGTSASAPYAAGVAAQILSLRPTTTPAALQTAFMTTGQPLTDVNNITRDRIDATAAYAALAGGLCVPDASTACLQNGRFEVKVSYTSTSGAGQAQVMVFNGQRAENLETAFFTFFSTTNFEMGVKVLNACVPSFGNKFWVFVSGLTDQGWTITVRDTSNNAIKTYSNTLNHLSATFADTSAFGC
jgi:subtilisin family serine protease